MQSLAGFARSPGAKRGVTALLLTVFAIASSILLGRFVSNFFSPLQPRRALLNASSFTFVAFVLLILFYARGSDSSLTDNVAPWRWSAFFLAAIGTVAILAYLPSLADPFLFDDYTHLSNSARRSWGQMLTNSLYVHLATDDFFFRPLGYISYWLDYRWAGDESFRWHLWNVMVHGLNSVLVYALGRQLRLSRIAALFAGLIFAVDASHAEVTGWVAARFDLLAFLFSLCALLALNRFVDVRKSIWLVAMGVATLFAVLSKEAAFCLPLWALCVIPFRRPAAVSIAKMAGIMAGVCAITFFYRHWFLGGIGGYQTQYGTPTIFNFHLLGTPNALLFRMWGLLLFPLNWSAPPGIWLTLALTLMLVVLALLLTVARANRARLLGSLGFVLAAALPVQHLLLIGPDLAGARVLYLPTLGIALFWGVLLDGCDKPKLGVALGSGLLLFHWGALQHNLRLRSEAAYLSQRVCRAIGWELQRDPRPILVEGLPRTWQGVYFLANGFVPCVAIQSQTPSVPARLYVAPNPIAASAQPPPRVFRWSPDAEALVETTHRTK